MNNSELKILAVDDNSINLKLLSRTLTNSSFNVVTAASGQEAIDVSLKEKPDLILLDVLMPHMDGYQACKILKETEATKHIPVIFLSAKNETIDKAKGLSLGAVDYLTKPFDPVEIVARIRTHLTMREEVIELRRKYEDLKLRSADKMGDLKDHSPYLDQLKYIDALKNINYREMNKFFQVTARVKFSKPPVTTIFIPGYIDNQNYIYLISGGFEKDYKTSFVQLLLEKYVHGYLKSLGEKNYTEKDLGKMFDLILDLFSPDVYDTAFTLSMGYVNSTRNELSVFAMHQTIPQVLCRDGSICKTEFTPIYYESKYTRIIKAFKLKMPPGSVIFNYVAGKTIASPEELRQLAAPAFKTFPDDLMQSIEYIYNNSTEKENDQLIMAIKILNT